MDRAPDAHRVLDDLLGRQAPLRDVQAEPRRLGDLPVLAEDAVERAADGRDRVRERARVDVEQRLLLDRVQAGRGHGAVGQAPQGPVTVLAHAADPVAPGPHQAAVGADAAADAPVGQGLGQDRRDGVGVGAIEQRHVDTRSLAPAGRPLQCRRDPSGGTSALSPQAARRTIRPSSEARAMARPDIASTPGSTRGRGARQRRWSAAGRDPTRRAGPPPRPGARRRRRRGRRTAGHGTGRGPRRGAAAGPPGRRLRHADRGRGAPGLHGQPGRRQPGLVVRGRGGALGRPRRSPVPGRGARRARRHGDRRVHPGPDGAARRSGSVPARDRRDRRAPGRAARAAPAGGRGQRGTRAHRHARRVLPEGGSPGRRVARPGTELWVFRTHRFGGPAA